MDVEFRRQLEKVAREVYEDVRTRRVGGLPAHSTQGAAEEVLRRISEEFRSHDSNGLPGAPAASETKTGLGIWKSIALLHLEMLLIDLQSQDQDQPKTWKR